jgi:hypothetical protein
MAQSKNMFDGWLDREVLEYAGLLIEQIKFLETQFERSETTDVRDAIIDDIADKKGSLVTCVTELASGVHD